MDEPKILPEWRQAVRDFLQEGFKAGDVISKAWLEEHFEIRALDEDEQMTAAEYQERQFKWLQCIDSFRAELLEEHQIYLANVHGTGYRLVPPGDQTAVAQDRFEAQVRKAYKQTDKTLRNVRLAELTDDERRKNVDAIAKLSMLRGMHKGLLE